MLNGRYKPLNLSLSGGQSRIELFLDTFLERRVAIKTIPGGDDQRRLLDEIAALGAIRSKHVVQVYDVLLVDVGGAKEPALVLELVEGDDLYTVSAQQRPADYLNRLLYQLATAISDIHAADVVHRDINPNNAKVDAEGTLKVFDFGLARSPDALRTVGTVGTPGFMAPELQQPGSNTVYFTPAIDVYAFGATALFLRSRQLAVADSTPFAELGFSPTTADVLDQTLAEDPARRPTMNFIANMLADELLFDKHQARVITDVDTAILNSESRQVFVDGDAMGSCFIDYDGLAFTISRPQGDIYINNAECEDGARLRASCLITIGAQYHGARRQFVTFDISHPEIAL